ncbi:dihydrodipicolinate reductase [Candidatus Blochmanniella pennsylvanica str. BPEN]|uniref:4-hydroxy-tetrahydrodipicolinate reductase n=1 Tax=Blochmanniella pennsylvanica (strain BPEN) TaxID=291272 RepID=DAPB_BLOPB|nr:4-hydroxy-tetrahydrodipicolinate reductase [Candidatus Blochmannia pennsylvanicus]Q493S0.1 RecName: Full=4-hydroxy-tetrahydrodipicolinate reductase; Short=HTPA reductase [Candidatus Blochmannia pennsylvanicus str. BPEN]AAZ40765.1 dihydrodipicolinate reductase [Candidatus Blochmannia pennsylvanicus str. BPEN]UOY04545.1 4-hydroxy-tetrahydrodipicolinate reductase [Candidatus Blochmannia pennsylvanicus]
MSDTPLRIAVTGVTGRMGKEIVTCIVKEEKQFSQEIVLGAAITRLNTNICGMDAGILINTDALGIEITDNLESIKDNFDVLVDFTAPDISIEYLKFCVNNNKNIVIGTTGFNQIHKNIILNASHKIGIVFSSNFSIGVALISKLLHKITQVIGNTSDISIIETHHNRKRDIPSGTSLTMQNIIVNALRSIHSNRIIDSNLDSTTYSPASSYKDILIHSIRAGDVVGEHTVLFAGPGERLEITHKASDRLIFAHGALRAAFWVGRDKIGLFDISDILEMDTLL